jgi:hypothetical protein
MRRLTLIEVLLALTLAVLLLHACDVDVAEARTLDAPACTETFTVPYHHRAAKQIYGYSHTFGNFKAEKVTGRERQRLLAMRECARSEEARAKMLRLLHTRKSNWRQHNRIDALTPYAGYGGEWATPAQIVWCESSMEGYWPAHNPSGAVGPYQLLGWGAPYPANTWRKRAVHHEIAAELWSGGSGASHWDASRHCWG